MASTVPDHSEYYVQTYIAPAVRQFLEAAAAVARDKQNWAAYETAYCGLLATLGEYQMSYDLDAALHLSRAVYGSMGYKTLPKVRKRLEFAVRSVVEHQISLPSVQPERTIEAFHELLRMIEDDLANRAFWERAKVEPDWPERYLRGRSGVH